MPPLALPKLFEVAVNIKPVLYSAFTEDRVAGLRIHICVL
jgi:hypothetical protein